ncbi:WD40 repeat-like protein [Exidia glandulosa HHB12029]|uniref:WD40 repeat-like protein n=1 Tax=Exidia glandulosa HHB12029 TaxID=1314781 RepID=A0A165PWF9_EXIGL|nr:WD40 repeat-like protein [Exidia glandulosa HHB12029]
MCFDDRGDSLVTAAEDEQFRLYNAKTGKFKTTFKSGKYGVDLIRFTHNPKCLIYASTKEEDAVRYHSLHDNRYLQYFKGHKKRVISLEMSPVDDGFISASVDQTVRLWDLRTPNARGVLHLPGDPIVAYDTTGVIFAVGVNQFARILLYDAASFDKEPFLTIALHDPTLGRISFPPRPIYMTSLSFSTDGKWLLVGTSGDAHYVLDAFDGRLLARLQGHVGLERGKAGTAPGVVPVRGISGEEVCWTPDSKYIVGGSQAGKILVWDISAWVARFQSRLQDIQKMEEARKEKEKQQGNGTLPPVQHPDPFVVLPMASMEGHHGPSRTVKFNPRFAMMASAGAELAFWLPDPAGENADKDGDVKMKGT